LREVTITSHDGHMAFGYLEETEPPWKTISNVLKYHCLLLLC